MNNRYNAQLAEFTALIKDCAREELLSRFELQVFEQRAKLDGSVVTDADHAMQHRIVAALHERWPEIVVLGEEMSAQEQMRLLQHQVVCCLDPLDGTSNFASGIPFFATSLAILEHQRPILGLVYDPVRDECFSAVRGEGCWLNDETFPASAMTEHHLQLNQLMAVVDLKRLTEPLLTSIVTQHPFRSQRNFGSCALEWCWLAAGRIQLYLHGGQKLWDHAAGALILDQAGGQSETLEHEPVFVPRLEPRSVVAAYKPDAFQQWQAWISDHSIANATAR